MKSFHWIKNKKGAAMEWAIVFGLVIFALIALLLSIMWTSRINTKTAQIKFDRQADLEQVGEYFIRCCGISGTFPTGSEEGADAYSDSGFSWMDADTRRFFASVKTKYGYTFKTESKTEYNGFTSFYTESAFIRKLTVSKNGREAMTLIVEEYIDYDTKNPLIFTYSNNGASTFRVLDWSTYDIDEEFEEDSPGLLGQIWKAIGGGISKLVVKTETSDYYLFIYDYDGGFNITSAYDRVKKGSPLTLPIVEKDGYRFVEWTESTNHYAQGAVLTPRKNLTFIAHWEPWTVTFDANGGTSTPAPVSGVVNFLPAVSHPDPVKAFAGWKSSTDGTVYLAGTPFIPTNNTTLTAQWSERALYPVTYSAGGGEDSGSAPPNQNKIQGISLTLQGNSGNFEKNGQSVPLGNWTVTFDANGGNGGGTQTTAVNTTVSYTFDGWTDGAAVYAPGSTYTTDAPLSLRPHFKENAPAPVAEAVTVPSAGTRTGYLFDGWYDAAGNKITTDTYVPQKDGEVITARWALDAYMLTLSVPDGSASFSPSNLAEVPAGSTFSVSGRKITVKYPDGTTKSATATPQSGYDENSPSWSVTGGTITANTTVSVTFPPKQYTIKLSTDNAKVTMSVTSGSKVAYNTVVSFTVSDFDYAKNRSISVPGGTYYTDAACTQATDSTNTGTYYFKVPVDGGTVTVKSDSCIPSGTLITLADGTKKAVEDLTLDDKVLAFNHETGRTEAADITFIEADGWKDYEVIRLVWSNGVTSGIISEHGFFDLDLMKYVYIHADDYEQYIGHRFYTGTYDGEVYSDGEVVLTDGYITHEYVGCYSFPSVYHLNFFMEDMLSMPGGINGTFNIFAYDDDLRYNEQDMAESVAAFGLLPYEAVAEYMDYETFCAYPSQYLLVSIGKGIMTEEDLDYLITRYAVPYADVR